MKAFPEYDWLRVANSRSTVLIVCFLCPFSLSRWRSNNSECYFQIEILDHAADDTGNAELCPTPSFVENCYRRAT